LRKLLATASVAVLATATFGVGTASAHVRPSPPAEQTPGIKWFDHRVYVKKHNPDQAVVRVRYRCEGVGAHLWASVKQGKQVNRYVPAPERPNPPADIARAWYETPEGPVPVCDGRFRTLRYKISRVTEGTPGHPEPWKRLKNGRAWAQFVFFYVPEGANPADPSLWRREAFAGWVKVIKPYRAGHHQR
jgi:hypothetical protein